MFSQIWQHLLILLDPAEDGYGFTRLVELLNSDIRFGDEVDSFFVVAKIGFYVA